MATLIGLLATFVLMASGYAVQLSFFTNTDFAVLLVLFFLYTISLATLAMFCSVFIEKARTSRA